MTRIADIDHFVLTVASVAETCDFYARVLGMAVETLEAADGTTRTARRFGPRKINLHQQGREFEPKARRPVAGSGDFCLLTDAPLDSWLDRLAAEGVPVEQGPFPAPAQPVPSSRSTSAIPTGTSWRSPARREAGGPPPAVPILGLLSPPHGAEARAP